jgi:dihydroflavonol-4-reductase
MESTKPKVVITGVSGYLGSHVCLSFLRDGGYQVRGTVRDPNNESKVGPLRKAFGEELFSHLELFKADMLDDVSIDRAIEGCQYVVHTASPIPMKPPKDENILIKPAVEGTLSVLRAASKHKVKRVVFTSSGLSVIVRRPENRKTMYTEEDWADIDMLGPYEKSKTLAEKAAWDFINA